MERDRKEEKKGMRGRGGEKEGVKSRLSTSNSPSGPKQPFLYQYSIMYQMISSTYMSLFTLSSPSNILAPHLLPNEILSFKDNSN